MRPQSVTSSYLPWLCLKKHKENRKMSKMVIEEREWESHDLLLPLADIILPCINQNFSGDFTFDTEEKKQHIEKGRQKYEWINHNEDGMRSTTRALWKVWLNISGDEGDRAEETKGKTSEVSVTEV
jgi:hypothetical protein